MQNMLDALKAKRQEIHDAKNQLTKLLLELDLSELGQAITQAKAYLDVVEKEEKEIDNRLRLAAINCFEKTGEKNPVDGVKVIILKPVEYELDKAVRWAIDNATNMLKLDKRQFEKYAKAMSEIMPLEFVEIKEVPSVRIAKNI